MPKPIVGDNGSHARSPVHLEKTARNLPLPATPTLARRKPSWYYIGGITARAKAPRNAITNLGTNSYKRLVPGFEAPVKLAYLA